ncbi:MULTISPECIES: DUF1033 family protein [Streptococcus]|uniref:DUF1033 family protein n=1 Tax=Streptococcus caledonicus TaxID=2614158 RepID=A0ABW0UIU0_9STRE|nr:DUF1033 family protein [Streptococcus sp. S784/96/1]
MYQIIKLYGDFEPWWFLEDWKNDIVSLQEFQDFNVAVKEYLELLQRLKKVFPSFESRSSFLATFWDVNEQRWCEECDENLQQYHSIALLKDFEILPVGCHDKLLEEANDQPKFPSACALG